MRRDLDEARDPDIHAVPAFVPADVVTIPGAQDVDTMVALVRGTSIVRRELALHGAACLAADVRYSVVEAG